MYNKHVLKWNYYYNKIGLGVSWGTKIVDTHIIKYFSYYNFDKNYRVLDSGCGYGKNSKYIINEGYNLYGIDCALKPIRYCKKNILDGKFLLGDILNFKFDNKFDVIIDAGCFHVINVNDSLKVVKKYNSILKKNGYLFIRVFSNDEEIFLIDNFLPVWNYSKEKFLKLIKPFFIVDKIIFDEKYSKEDKIYYYYLRKK